MIKLYDNPLSGNCFKVKLLLVQSKIPFESIMIDVFKGESRRESFLRINNAGKIPAIDDNGFILNESNAILLYLAEKYNKNLLSVNIDERGKIYSWILYNKTSVDPNLAKARAIKKFFPSDKQNLKELEFLQKEGIKSLELIDKHLSGKDFLLTNILLRILQCIHILSCLMKVGLILITLKILFYGLIELKVLGTLYIYIS